MKIQLIRHATILIDINGKRILNQKSSLFIWKHGTIVCYRERN